MLINIALAATKSFKPAIKDFLELLQVPTTKSDSDQEKILQLRISKLGEGKTCPRCGGSGNYSYNLTRGTVCFQCDGIGTAPLKKTDFNAALYTRLKEKVDAGELEDYIARTREFAKVKKIQLFAKKFMDKWGDSNIDNEYDWSKAAKGIQPDKDISDLVNRPVSERYTQLRDLCLNIDRLQFKITKAKTKAEKESYQKEILAVSKRIEEDYEDGLKLIEEKVKLLPKLKAKWEPTNDH